MARAVPLAVLVVSVAALATAYLAETVFGLEPCALCLYQRIPYGIAALLAAAALLVARRAGARAGLVALCAAVFLAGAGLAFYHVGVERHWWGSIAACGEGDALTLSLDELKARLSGETPTRKPCDRVDWTLFGVSLAGYNVMLSSVLGLACWAAAGRIGRGGR